VQRAIAIISKSIDQWEKQLLSEKNHWYTMLTVKCVGWTLAGDIIIYKPDYVIVTWFGQIFDMAM
jgi:hypothetical protein